MTPQTRPEAPVSDLPPDPYPDYPPVYAWLFQSWLVMCLAVICFALVFYLFSYL
jgi:hypothetical protein